MRPHEDMEGLAWAIPVEPEMRTVSYARHEHDDWLALVLAWSFVVLFLLAVITPIFGTSNCTRAINSLYRVQSLRSQIALYKMHCGTSPPNLAALLDPNAAGNPPGWNGPYLSSNSNLNDVWAHPYRYQLTHQAGGDVATIRSAGPDSVFDNADDLAEAIELGP